MIRCLFVNRIIFFPSDGKALRFLLNFDLRKMDEELLELQRQFEFAQQVKSSVRLSDRNVVELVQKLQELRVIDFDLLHTVTGKEYITQVHFY